MGNICTHSHAKHASPLPSKYSNGVALNDGKERTSIVLSPQTTNIVAILTVHNTQYGVEFKAKFELDYGAHASPVIGFFGEEPYLESLWLEDDDFSFWYLTTGRLVVKGKESPLRLPVCETGAVIDINVASTSVALTVTNPGSRPQDVSFTLPDISQNSLPFVGAVRTGRRKVVFELYNNTDLDLSDHAHTFPSNTHHALILPPTLPASGSQTEAEGLGDDISGKPTRKHIKLSRPVKASAKSKSRPKGGARVMCVTTKLKMRTQHCELEYVSSWSVKFL